MPTYEIATLNGTAERTIPQWTELSYQQELGKPDVVSFKVPGDDDALDYVYERLTDVLVYRRHARGATAVKVARARVLEMSDTLDDETYDVSVACADVRALLANRLLFADRTYTSTAQASIAWDLISTTQALTHGSLGITVGTLDSTQTTATGNTVMVRSRKYVAGEEIGKLIDDLAAQQDGFDWWIDADLKLQVATPRRERTVATPLRYKSNVAKLERASISPLYRNVVYVKGDNTTSAVVATNTSSTYGRWEQAFNLNELHDQDAVAQSARRLLAEGANPRATFGVKLAPGVWGDEVQLQLGDVVPVQARRGRLTINTTARVTAIGVSVTADGGEEVSMTLRQEP